MLLYDFIWDDLGGMKYMHYFTRYWSADEVYHGKPIHLNKLLFLLAEELTTINNSRIGLKSSLASYQYICSRKVLYNEPWPGMNTMINLVVRVSVTIFHFLLIKPPINSVKILKIAASHIWLKILDITFSLQILFDLLYRAEPNRCDMTYMYEYPQFIPIPMNSSSKYKLVAYGEGEGKRTDKHGNRNIYLD